MLTNYHLFVGENTVVMLENKKLFVFPFWDEIGVFKTCFAGFLGYSKLLERGGRYERGTGKVVVAGSKPSGKS
jgi:hypothetical protein